VCLETGLGLETGAEELEGHAEDTVVSVETGDREAAVEGRSGVTWVEAVFEPERCK